MRWISKRFYPINIRYQRLEKSLKNQGEISPVFPRILESKGSESPDKITTTPTEYHTIINSVGAAISCFHFYLDGTWEIEYRLTDTAGVFGYTSEELTSKVWESRVLPEHLVIIYQQALEAILAGKMITLEYQFYHKDGSLRWICDTLTPQWDETENFWRVFAIAFDISTRKQAELELQQREQDFRALVENSPDIVSRVDRQFRFLYLNPRVAIETGISTSDWIGKTELELGFPEAIVRPWHEVVQQVFAKGKEQLYESEFPSADGTTKYWQCRLVPEFNPEGEVESVLTVSRDITERKIFEEALHQCVQHERLLGDITDKIRQSLELETILETTVVEVQKILQADRVFIYRFNPDWSGTIVTESVVAGFESILGRNCRDSYLVETRGEAFRQGHIQALDDVQMINFTPCHQELLKQLQIRASLLLPICIYPSNSQGEANSQTVWGLLGINSCVEPRHWQTQDIEFLNRLTGKLAIAVQQSALYQRLKKANEELQYLAHYDQLTQVANRRYFDQYFEEQWHQLQRKKAPLSFILCDVDYFKPYNDTYGHVAGDNCLVQVAQAISRSVQHPTSLVARYGGEEFAIILPNTHAKKAIEIVHQIQQEILNLNILHSTSLTAKHITLSFGIAYLNSAFNSSRETLIRQADNALYQAKDAGRNCYSLVVL